MRLALFEPDNPQNAGALVRLAACFGAALEVIEPCGFPWDDRRLRRVAMDYVDLVPIERHASWARFRATSKGRLVLLSTKGPERYDRFAFRPDDTLLVGRESAGAPADVHAAADARLVIPMAPGARSLNIVTAAAIVLAEAKRQADIQAEAKRQADIQAEAKRQADASGEEKRRTESVAEAAV
jgi:tRNA (cytidine/uridine-2'-O-)-methyltransferase